MEPKATVYSRGDEELHLEVFDDSCFLTYRDESGCDWTEEVSFEFAERFEGFMNKVWHDAMDEE